MYNSNQSFSRYEFKYLISNDLSNEIQREVKFFMDYDGYVNKDLENSYFVRSLYYDNIFHTSFYEKADGVRKRSKFRLRTYSRKKDNKTPIYLEEKGRNNQRTYKTRALVDLGHLDFFLDMNKDAKLISLYDGNALIERFVFDSIKKRLNPVVLIDYIRRPYVNKYGLYFRLTFDSNIMSTPCDRLFAHKYNLSSFECRAGYTILEVKFDRSIPPWFHRVIQNYNLHRLSISKFVIGAEQCGIAYDV